ERGFVGGRARALQRASRWRRARTWRGGPRAPEAEACDRCAARGGQPLGTRIVVNDLRRHVLLHATPRLGLSIGYRHTKPQPPSLRDATGAQVKARRATRISGGRRRTTAYGRPERGGRSRQRLARARSAPQPLKRKKRTVWDRGGAAGGLPQRQVP